MSSPSRTSTTTGPVNSLSFIVNDTVPQSIKVESEHGMITVVARLHSGRNKVEIQSDKPIAIDSLTVKAGREGSGKSSRVNVEHKSQNLPLRGSTIQCDTYHTSKNDRCDRFSPFTSKINAPTVGVTSAAEVWAFYRGGH